MRDSLGRFIIGHQPHPNWIKLWPVKRLKQICQVCSKSYLIRPKRLKNNRGYTCSRLCGNKLAGIKRSINGNGQTEERRRKMSKMMHGEKSPNWRGGVSSKNERARHGFRFKIWREKVFKRDKYQCVNCGKSRCELHPDHIKQFAYHPSLRFDITNGRTLCIECHKKTPTYSSQKHVCCNKGR